MHRRRERRETWRHATREQRRAMFQEWVRRYPGAYFRFHLRRRLFFWFAAVILLTAATVGTMAALLTDQTGWMRQMERGKAFAGHQFEKVWDDPAARTTFATQTAQDLGVDLELFDAQGHPMLVVGQQCLKGVDVPVTRGGQLLGSARACGLQWHMPFSGKRFLLGLAAVVFVLWMAAGRMSKRLARPMDELVRTVQKIGQGDLKARAVVGRRDGEFGLVADAVNEMAGRIEKLMADQRELLAAVSHELRTPLSRIRLLTEIARGAGANEKTCDDLDREVVEMDALVGQLLAHSRVEFGAMQKRPLLVADAVGAALERAGLKRELLESSVEKIDADPTLLARALANLFDNASKHGKGASRVLVHREGANVALEVWDNGPGIPAGDEKKVFDAFYRGDHGREGLGLGLALVQRIGLAHGGRAWAKNRPEGGAVVALEVPADQGSRT